MAIIKLHKGDFRIIKPVAFALYEHWKQKKESSFGAIFNGISCEYAVIKYINETMGANPAIPFNEKYIDGKDGGIDFKFPDDMSWDVKSSTMPYLNPNYALKTKAQVVCGVQKLPRCLYKIMGFAPLQKLFGLNDIKEEDFLPIEALMRLFPAFFSDKNIVGGSENRKYTSHFEKIGKLIPDAVASIKLRL